MSGVESCDGGVYTAKRLEAISNAEPQDARRASLRKKSDTIERHVERRFTDRNRERIADALLERVFDRAEKMQRQVHAIGTYPRRFRMRLEPGPQFRGNASDLLAGHLIDINRNE